MRAVLKQKAVCLGFVAFVVFIDYKYLVDIVLITYNNNS